MGALYYQTLRLVLLIGAALNVNLWQGVNGVNNPCPTGYRIPTVAEWEAEIASWSAQSIIGAFASPLKLPAAGNRYSSGFLSPDNGGSGFYWSSTVGVGLTASMASLNLYFASDNANHKDASVRSNGLSVRCIKN
ncbi:MAG: FISUMP domain-containing protein [Bacteroidetes bacterium]|nr:FISUMP domain-containing protein [Bacteroidota bacterium]